MTTTFDALGTLAHPRIQQRREAVDLDRQRRLKMRAGAVALAGMLALAAVAVISSPMLDVDEIRVVGASAATVRAVTEAVEVGPGTPLLGLDFGDDIERVGELLTVRSATMTKDWDGTVTIEVLERVPAARIETADGPITVSADGLVLTLAGSTGPRARPVTRPDSGLPLISGAMFSTEVGRWVPSQLDDALRVAEALPADVAALVERIEISVDGLDLALVGGARIELADGRDLDQKLDSVRAFLAHVDLSCVDNIDVSAPRVPVLARRADCR